MPEHLAEVKKKPKQIKLANILFFTEYYYLFQVEQATNQNKRLRFCRNGKQQTYFSKNENSWGKYSIFFLLASKRIPLLNFHSDEQEQAHLMKYSMPTWHAYHSLVHEHYDSFKDTFNRTDFALIKIV